MRGAKRICPKHGEPMRLHRAGTRAGKQRWRMMCLRCTAERVAATRKRNGRRWEAANPEKRRAHKAVENALIGGRLTKEPCVRCGRSDFVHAHHDDYRRHLDVVWLCPAHHKERHRILEGRDA